MLHTSCSQSKSYTRDMELYATWLEIDLKTLVNNLHQIENLTATPALAVIKANAYGHGLAKVAEALEKAGIAWLGVARAEEALELREAGVNTPILVLGYTPPAIAPEAIKQDVSLCVYDLHVMKTYDQLAQKENKSARIHIKVDTGMSRLGIKPDELEEFVAASNKLSHTTLEGIFSHLSKADEADKSYTKQQVQKFELSLRKIKRDGLLIHSANSAGALSYPDSHYNLVRLGIALYGLSPSSNVSVPKGIKPALSWKALVSQVKKVPKGTLVSYGGIYETAKDEMIATVPVGYGDGFRRVPHQSASVLIHGQKAPVVGRVCMDNIMVNVSHIKDVKIDDEVVIIGEQNGAKQSADDLAEAWGTINYEVVTGLSARLPRIYK